MSNIAIKVENLSKQYRLGQVGTGTISHDLNRWWHSIRGKEDPYLKIGESNDRTTKGTSEYVWALQDINFEVKQGEVLGIIGKNGAGKSTLLKILSKVTSPTTGSIKARGRIASLLEVGTGFHPEMTGRENIFMNGTIMGMNRHEIASKLEEIVEFAGIAKYIDTPVKRYSSGMTVRLGFAIAAHLEPEILIVDEVLAVGDAEFQKKAIGKMQDVSKGEGRTILFVSHDMQSISTLTSEALLLDKGTIKELGPTKSIINTYLQGKQDQPLAYTNHKKGKPHIASVSILTSAPNNHHIFGEPLEIEIILDTPISLKGASISFQIMNTHDVPIIHLWSFDSERAMCRKPGQYKLRCQIPKSRLYMGHYSLNVYFTGPPGGDKYEILQNICPFKIEMFSLEREFTYQKDTCTYIEDSQWEVNLSLIHI